MDTEACARTCEDVADLWEELSSELPAIFTQRTEVVLKTATLDDILGMLPW